MARLLLLCMVIVIASFPLPFQRAASADALETAQTNVEDAVSRLDAYKEDPLSAFERREIRAVERDIRVIERDAKNLDKAKYIDDAKTLKRDWDLLVGLDLALQRESVL